MKTWKKILLTLAIPTLIGTYSGNEGGFPPFYVKKTGTTGGICIGAVTEFAPGSKFYGINLGFYNTFKENSQLHGANLSIVTENKGTVNGANLQVVGMNNGTVNGANSSIFGNISRGGTVNGLESAILLNVGDRYSVPFQDGEEYPEDVPKINGLQVSLLGNFAQEQGNYVQLGLFNDRVEPRADNQDDWSFLLGHHFE